MFRFPPHSTNLSFTHSSNSSLIPFLIAQATEAAFSPSISGARSVRELRLSNCHLLTDTSATLIAQLQLLERLDVSGCLKLTDESVRGEI